MAKRLLFFHNSASPVISDRLDEYFAGLGLDVDVRWAVNGEFPESIDDYDGIFFSGSPAGPWEPLPWITAEIDVVREAARRRIPVLGTCFGSQVLAYALCGPDTVSRRDTYETGFVPLTATPALADDQLGRGLPASFPIFTWHRDEVVAAHPDMILLARSEQCGNHIWRYRELPVWGIQGHPEVGGPHGREWFLHYVNVLNSDGLPTSLVPTSQADAVRTPDALRLFGNFADYLRSSARL